jgi:hypothetical protein
VFQVDRAVELIDNSLWLGNDQLSVCPGFSAPFVPDHVLFLRKQDEKRSSSHNPLFSKIHILFKLEVMFGLLFAALAAPLLALAAPVQHSKRTPGRATFYQVGLGACGQYNNPGDFVSCCSLFHQKAGP